MTLYHATDYNNLVSILDKGIKPGCDGVVYCCLTVKDCMKFLYFRRDFVKSVVIFELEIDDTENIVETFDHSEAFFKCKCYGVTRVVHTSEIRNMKLIDLQ